MSEIFEALQKAQRLANAGQAVPAPATGATANNGGAPAQRAEGASVRPGPPQRRTSVPHRFRWLRHALHRSGQHQDNPLALISPGSVIGEQFRMLRTRVEIVGPGIFVITSALAQEGKTLCATSLAAALALRVGPEVVLVDADLRHPSVASYFDLNGNAGLLDCLMGEASWEDCVQPTRYERLRVLPAGRSSALAPELLGSERMATILSEIKARFSSRHILIDAPPILLTADAMVLARHADHVLLVVRAGMTPREAVFKAIETLAADRFLGIVLNDATQNVTDYYYKTYYNGNYFNQEKLRDA